ncbi:hypothetical protein [Arenimonas fontis]|uniref:Uncharacterized protein n=1 Tax=Arenimonas fontis TaxID=2608255 RepID=A0A5B2ZDT3_9GAMM|nr:hypothetical protein [Arenimonas fontis]KAA2285783.1 hypothetical protein F0415_03940 [Arenimonas fontis]
MFRTLLAVVLGTLAAGLAVAGVQALGHWLYPPPVEVDWRDRAAVTALIDSLPVAQLAFVPAAYAVGSFVGGFVGGTVSALHKRGAALAVGLVMLALVVVNFAMIPHPMWMVAAGVLVPLPLAWLGGRFAL